MQKRLKIKQAIQKRLAKYGLIALAIVAPTIPFSTQTDSTKKSPKTEVRAPTPETDSVPLVKNPTLSIVFQRDTLEHAAHAIAYHKVSNQKLEDGKSVANGTIVYNYVENNDTYILNLGNLLHEKKHNQNFKKNLRLQFLTPLQYIKMCAHDEISANIVQVCQARFEYLAAQTPQEKEAVLKHYDSTRFSFYSKAIRDKKIFPEKKDALSRDQEWRFIMNETQKMWMKKMYPFYTESFLSMSKHQLAYRYDPSYTEAQTKRGYQNVLKIAYTIGGVDFSKYMNEDIIINQKDLLLLAEIGNLSIDKNNKGQLFDNASKTLKNLRESNTPISQETLRHVYLSEGIKLLLKDISPEQIRHNPALINACYRTVCTQLGNINADKTMRSISNLENISSFPNLAPKRDVIDSLYTYQGINMADCIAELDNAAFSFGGAMTLFSSDEWYLQTELENLRQKTPPVTNATPTKQSRRSGDLAYEAPDFSQPILVSATPEQEEAIYTAIRKFNNMPDVLKGTNSKAKAEYLKTHSNVSDPSIQLSYNKQQERQ